MRQIDIHPSLDRSIDRGGQQGTGAALHMAEFVSFSVDEEVYGVEITDVREIRGWSGVTELPGQPEYVRGVLNLRGAMVPIIDLRCRFGRGVTDASPLHVVIIVQIESTSVGILADRVLDIVSIDSAQIQPVPRVTREQQSELFSGLVTVDEGMIALIDLGHLIDQADGGVHLIAAAAEQG